MLRCSCLIACLMLMGCSSLLHNDKFKVESLPAQAIANPYLFDRQVPLFEQARPAETYAFPIQLGQVGPVAPLFAGGLQYPFACETRQSALGQPLVDNHQGIGTPVYREVDGDISDIVIGHSKDCLIKTRVDYFYLSTDGKVYSLLDGVLPNDVVYTALQSFGMSEERVPVVFRVERGSINRFLYMITMLAGPNDKPDEPDISYWNRRLIFQMKGGVGIGRRQGKLGVPGTIEARIEQLKQGYALAYSTGNHTRQHYNMLLSEDTALRLKRQVSSRYGKPLYTVGVGGSGGGLQQYLFAQNNHTLLDAAIPQYSYPDMVTQTIHALDCDLLEYYFDIQRRDKSRWHDWEQRQLIEGMNARNHQGQKYQYFQLASQLAQGYWPRSPNGASECTNGWRGLTSLTTNPRFVYFYNQFSEAVFENTHWTYWDDLNNIFGYDDNGYARRTWDNVGVQYGLAALRQGQIPIDVFLDINQHVGGWKAAKDFEQELFWLLFDGKLPVWFSIWGQNNMQLAETEDGIAPRTEGDTDAMQMAYLSGQVFIGRATIPIIDVRHYLEERLDMHHMMASFATRLRMIQFQGHADNQVIWVAHADFDPTDLAFEVMEQWMQQRLTGLSVLESKPDGLQDGCFDHAGTLLHQGKGVWDGAWNHQSPGACSRLYPTFTNTRIAAGAPFHGRIFKCQLQSIQDAIAAGVYEPVDMASYQTQLETIFPHGVCDYAKEDTGMPAIIQSYLKYSLPAE